MTNQKTRISQAAIATLMKTKDKILQEQLVKLLVLLGFDYQNIVIGGSKC